MKKEGYIYCITHIPSSKQYIGQFNKNPRVRFMEHLCGYGSICIWDLICQGEREDNFRLEILERDISKEDLYNLESQWVKNLNCAFPNGLNAGFASSFFKKYKRLLKEVINNKWCLNLFECDIINKSKNTILQDRILLLAKNQTDVNMISEDKMREWRKNRNIGYSRKNVFLTNDMTAFFIAREKEYERVRSGNFTEAEKKAQANKSKDMKKVWENRTKSERAEILKKATAAASGKNKDHKYKILTCPHCNTSGGGGNMIRYHFDNCKHNEN